MTVHAREVNFDGLVGPTHNYGGLSPGNVASQTHLGEISNPKAAALQGLEKMKRLADLGLQQAVLPPQERPDIETLRRLGFGGSEAETLARAGREAPHLLTACSSASSMWAANAATVSPSADTSDGRVHFTAANLIHHLHRAIEADTTARFLQTIFPDPSVFAHHEPLPDVPQLGDEGAANHMRLCLERGESGLEVFVFGDSAGRFPRRQRREASAAIARSHGLDPHRTFLVQQHPSAIDAGVFHNDVIAVANQNVLFHHTSAFAGGVEVVNRLRSAFADHCGGELVVVAVTPDQLPVGVAVQTYLFNSQLVTLPDGAMALVCPTESETDDSVRGVLDGIVADNNPISHVEFVNTRQSMKNGGGPACLRLTVALTDDEAARVHPPVFFGDRLYATLRSWIEKHYRDQLAPADLADPRLLTESRDALDELTRILELGSIYRFQCNGRPEGA